MEIFLQTVFRLLGAPIPRAGVDAVKIIDGTCGESRSSASIMLSCESMRSPIILFCTITVSLLLGAAVLHFLPRLGIAGRKLSESCCRAPLLDGIVGYFTVLPLIAGAAALGWGGFLLAIFAQLATLLLWQTVHEAVHRDAVKGPRIIKVLNKKFGPVRNLTAVYVTALATPIFWAVRMGELVVYPPLVFLVRLPAYKAEEWVNVSRQKFSGLVGHDLIWCLYCDWMTGVWSLGTEMLRNVESLWCPIRFSCDKKCENCAIDFPDVENGWVPATAGMAEVVATLDRMYSSDAEPQPWFGHPLRKERQSPAEPKQASSTGDKNADSSTL